MKFWFLGRLGRKSKSKKTRIDDQQTSLNGAYISPPLPPNYTTILDAKLLAKIFQFVCPHSLDTTYRDLDHSSGKDGSCMACDTRDLANCARVCKVWHDPALRLL
jgi:hypothetical protein